MRKQVRHKGPVLAMNWRVLRENHTRLAVGPGAVGKLPSLLGQIDAGKRVLLLHPDGLPRHLHEEATEELLRCNYEVFSISLPDGEDCKSLENIVAIWNVLQDAHFDRSDTIVAVGGGALSDAAGFAASTYLRGINLVTVPTTLLAQVDAAIGGKTAINLSAGKNLAGSFYFPQAVVIDPDLLAGLSERDFKSGIGEIIKYALIEETVALVTEYEKGPRGLLELLEENLGEDFNHDHPLLTGIIISCVKMKLAVVGKDPCEQSLRRVLNLGHTMAHGVEKLTDYSVTHGEAVAIGLSFATRLSVAKQRLPAAEHERGLKLIRQAGLPTEIPDTVPRDRLFDAMKHDKKRQGNYISYILPNRQLGLVDFDSQLSLDELNQHL